MSNRFRSVTLLAGLLTGGLLACQASAADSERASLEAAIDRWETAVNSHDVATLEATMTSDVELIDGDATITGRDVVIRKMGEMVTRGQLIATSRELTLDNNLAWRVVDLVQKQKNGDLHSRGHALEIWRRLKGQWRLHRRMALGVVTADDLLQRPSTSEPVLDRPKN